MKILVTGAAGGVGSFVARELLEHGYEVRTLDRAALPLDLKDRVEVVYAEISDRLAVLRAVQGCDAIAHLAAIPNPMHGRELELFEPNVLGTQYVLAAAAAEGITKVVMASSYSIYGAPFATKPFEFKYLPIDEKHPIEPQDLYALSKQFNELTAATYTRRYDMATVCLRLTFTTDIHSPQARWMRRRLEHAHEWRSTDFWSYLDVRDAGRAFRLALENVESGHHVALVAARDLLTPHDRRDLIRRHFPDLESFFDSGFDFEKYGFIDTRHAEKLFGFVAEHSWRDIADLNDVESSK